MTPLRALLPLATLALAALGFGQIEHGYDLLDVNWSLGFNEETEMINGSVTNTIRLKRDSEGVRFHCAKLQIENAKVNGLKAKYTLDAASEQITVRFGKTLKEGTTVKVFIDYRGKPEAGVYFTPASRAFPAKTGMVYTQGQAYDTRYWLPTFDHPSDKATSESRITVPVGYYVLGNGKLVERIRANGRETFHWKMDQPHSTYLISFVAGKYSEGKETAFGNLSVNHYVPVGLEEWGKASYGHTAPMVEFFSQLMGVRYPYAKFGQALVADYPYGGMENISAVTNTLNVLYPPRELPLQDADGLNLHELAHQWFGDLVTCNDWSHAWINEGFATFLPHFYNRKVDGQSTYELQRRGTMMGAVQAMKDKRRKMIEESEIAMDNFDGHTYGGGAARMFVLMDILGEETFWKCVKQFLTDFGFKNATTEDFFRSFSATSGRDLDFFRREWFYRDAMPQISAGRKGTKLMLTQTAPVFTMDVEVLAVVNGQAKIVRVPMSGLSAEVELGSDNAPFAVDPSMRYAATVNYDVASESDAKALYQNAPGATLKARMIEVLAAKGWVTTLTLIADTETDKELRRSALASLPADQPDRWIRLSADQDPLLRRIAVQKMSASPKNDRIIARLQAMVSTEKSDTLRQEALQAYVGHTADELAVQRAWTMDSFNDGFKTFALGWIANKRPEDARRMALGSLTGASYPVQLTAVRVLGRLKDKAGERVVFNALVKYLGSTGFSGRMAAIGALQQYGDKAAIPAIKKFENSSMFMIRGAAQDAIAQLNRAR